MPLNEEPPVSSVPPPVAAALALLEGARRLPPKLPALAVSTALNAAIIAKTHYDELAERGEKIVAGWRGTSFDEIEDKVEDRLQGTRLATPYDKVEDAIEDATAKVADLLDRAASRGKKAPAPTGGVERVETAATPDVIETVQAVVDAVDTSAVISHDDLPLPDYDHMTLGSLRGRLRSLSVEELVQVRDYEKAHAHRLPVVTLLDNRIAKLATDAAASPSPGGEPPVLPTADKAKKPTAPKKASGPKKSAKPKPKVRTT
jgi:hypothetical protein